MAMRPQSALGEIPSDQRLPTQIGWSHGAPGAAATPASPLSYIDGSTRVEIVGTTAKVVVTRQTRRAYLMLQNRGAGSIFVSFGQSPGDYVSSDPVTGIELAPGAVYEVAPSSNMVMVSDVYAVADSADNILSVTEGVRIGD